MPNIIQTEKIVVDGKTELKINGQTVARYDSFQKGPELKFNKDTKIFTFKGTEITVGEAIFLCSEMASIMMEFSVAKPEDFHFMLREYTVGRCITNERYMALETIRENGEAPCGTLK
jgi:hypothetical protein